MEFDFNFWPLLLVMLIAWLSPLLTAQFKSVKIPSVIVEIVAGFIIGEHVLDVLPETEYINFLGLLGFVFLMFLSGFEVDVHKILVSLPKRKLTVERFMSNPLLVGLLVYAGTLVLAVLGALIVSQITPISNIWFFALIISTTSVGVIMPVLKERGEINKQFGQMLVLAAAVADLLSILLFTFTTSLIKNNGLQGRVFLIISLFVAFYVSYLLGKRLVKNNYLKRLFFQLAHAASQIKVRGTLVLILIFLFLSQLIDVEVILGAFMAGILMSIFTSKERSSLMLKLDAIGYGFFIPIFFILVGSRIDISVISKIESTGLFLSVLLLILFLIKVIPSLVWVPRFGIKRAIAGGLLMSSRLSLIIAAAQLGLQLNVISPATNTVIIILAVITCVFSPIFYNQLNKKAPVQEDKVIIVGGSYAGVLLARNLKMHGKQAIIIELDKSKVYKLESEGIEVVHANGANIDVYKQLELKAENYVIILTKSDEKNLAIARILRNDLQHEKIITHASKYRNAETFKSLEIESLYSSQTIATSIENLIFRPDTYHTLFESFESFSVEELTMTNINMEGKKVKDIPFHQDGFLMLIKRDGQMIVPHGEDYLIRNDVAVVFGSDTALNDFRVKFTGGTQGGYNTYNSNKKLKKTS